MFLSLLRLERDQRMRERRRMHETNIREENVNRKRELPGRNNKLGKDPHLEIRVMEVKYYIYIYK